MELKSSKSLDETSDQMKRAALKKNLTSEFSISIAAPEIIKYAKYVPKEFLAQKFYGEMTEAL